MPPLPPSNPVPPPQRMHWTKNASRPTQSLGVIALGLLGFAAFAFTVAAYKFTGLGGAAAVAGAFSLLAASAVGAAFFLSLRNDNSAPQD